jgi:hypothetical protein
MHEASLTALRLWELTCVVLWAVGLYLVYRWGRTRFLAGVYLGASLLMLWDYVLNSHWFFRITFDDRTLTYMTIDGHPFTAWAPFSYGFFFGITTLVCLRYRRQLDRLLGAWQFVAVGLALGLMDFVIEGITVGGLHLYRFEYRDSFLVSGVPVTNLLFIALAQATLLYLSRRTAELLETAGIPTVRSDEVIELPTAVSDRDPAADLTPVSSEGNGAVLTAVRPTTSTVAAAAPAPMGWAPLALGAAIPPAGMYAGALVTTFVLHWLNPWA